jgi:hypothetical protein
MTDQKVQTRGSTSMEAGVAELLARMTAGPRPARRHVDRSAMGLAMETMGRIIARDGEVTRRLLNLGVGGDDEEQIFDRIADRLAKLDVLVQQLGVPPSVPLEILKQNAAGYAARLSYAQSVIGMLAEAANVTELPGDTKKLKTFVEESFGAGERLKHEQGVYLALQREYDSLAEVVGELRAELAEVRRRAQKVATKVAKRRPRSNKARAHK